MASSHLRAATEREFAQKHTPYQATDGTLSQVRLALTVDGSTIDGRALLKIPQGTQNGQKFRLREKGVMNSRKNARGDQIVEVSVETPNVNDERTREILRELALLHPEDPREAIWSKVGD